MTHFCSEISPSFNFYYQQNSLQFNKNDSIAMDDRKVNEMKREIADYMKKKDYYDLLGVSRTAEEPEIKKAYKKLALRFHPDKNQVEGSKQVFKKVTNAYATLTNAEKKAGYDRYGPEQQRPQYQPQYQQRRNNGRDQQFDEFDEIFRTFFGGGAYQAQRARHHNHNQQYQNPNQNRQYQNQGQQRGGINFGYLIAFFIIIYVVAPLFKSKAYYAMNPSSQYKFKAQTDILHIHFYVREEYFSAANNHEFKRSIHETVDFQFVTKLTQTCDANDKLLKQYQYYAYKYAPGAYRDAYLQKMREVDRSACAKLQEIKRKNGAYVNKLLRSYY